MKNSGEFVKKIEFARCRDCPFLMDSFMPLCPILHPPYYTGLYDVKTKHKDCPYPKGLLICNCKVCPYQKDKYCTKIRERSLVPIPDIGSFHPDCPLEKHEVIK